MNATDLHIGTEPQLFLDSDIVEVSQGMTRIWHKPHRHSDTPLISADRPWERLLYFTYSNYVALHDPQDGLVKCWYEDLGEVDTANKQGQRHPWKSRLLYAESEDGIQFRKPELDVVAIEGKPTNIVMGYENGATGPTKKNPWANVGVHSNGIVIDPYPPSPEERFRTIFTRQSADDNGNVRHSLECAHSPDGIHWTPYPEPPRAGGSRALDDVCCLHYDTDARLFVMNTRHGHMYANAEPPGTPFGGYWFPPYHPHRPDLMNKRRIFQTVSADFLNWRQPLPLLAPNDTTDNLDEAYYGMQQFRVGRTYIGTMGIFQYVRGEMEVRLMQSRDSIHFQPSDKGNAFLSPRGDGHWDGHMVSMTSPPVEKGDEWFFYHGGTSAHHDWWMDGSLAGVAESDHPNAHAKFGLGLARMRKEGVASLWANSERGGYMLTRPVKSKGKQLLINARCQPGGSVRAAVLDQENRPVGGCTSEHSDAFTGDSTSHVMTWKGSSELAGTTSGWRKIHFLLRNAEIFSFRIVSEAPDKTMQAEFLHGTKT
jgi:hypothetical protein